MRDINYNSKTRVKISIWQAVANQKLFVLKYIPVANGYSELHITRKLSGAGIEGVIKLDHSVQSVNGSFLFFEKEKNTIDLFEYIKTIGNMPVTPALRIVRKTVTTLLTLREHGIIHGDVKDENILINTDTLDTKLIDFGACVVLPNKNSAILPLSEGSRSTRIYLPPEFHRPMGKHFDADAATVWAIGSMLCSLIYRNIPYDTVEEMLFVGSEEKIESLLRQPLECEDCLKEQVNGLIKQCLLPLSSRILFSHLLNHVSFKQLDFGNKM